MAEPKQGYDVVSAHMLKEDFIQRGLKDDRFPFRVSAAFSLLALFLLLLASLAADRNEMLMAAGGTDLLLIFWQMPFSHWVFMNLNVSKKCALFWPI